MALRYGMAELLIVQPGVLTYATAPPAHAPHVGQALAWAAGEEPRHEMFGDVGRREAHERITILGHAQHPERLTAPPPLGIELALSAAELLIAALAGPTRGWRSFLLRLPPVAAASLPLGIVRRRAERASARRLGVTATTAPHLRYGFSVMLPFVTATTLHRLLRGGPPPRSAWTIEAATKVVGRFNQRRAWKRAYAAALSASQD